MHKRILTYLASQILSRTWTRHVAFFLINGMGLEQLLRKLYRISKRPPKMMGDDKPRDPSCVSAQTTALHQQLCAEARRAKAS